MADDVARGGIGSLRAPCGASTYSTTTWSHLGDNRRRRRRRRTYFSESAHRKAPSARRDKTGSAKSRPAPRDDRLRACGRRVWIRGVL
eukprot:1730110-Prymnesium_polylepis.1